MGCNFELVFGSLERQHTLAFQNFDPLCVYGGNMYVVIYPYFFVNVSHGFRHSYSIFPALAQGKDRGAGT